MALVQTGWELSVSLMDSGNDVTSKTFELNAPADAAAAAAAASTLMTRLQAVSAAELIGYRLSQVFAEDAPVTPGAAVENPNQAVITVRIDGNPLKKATVVIPAADAGIFVAATGAGKNTVDFTDAALIAYLNSFAVGGLALISDGEEIETNGFDSGYRRHIRSRRG